jgi:WS/DGAT/MGAT family acyltransferase
VSDRLTALDSSFLDIESPTAHMHVGWGALFAPPDDRPAPTFEEIRHHIAGRMHRAPRYRQRVEHVPFGIGNPVWVDDAGFSVARHVRRTAERDFGAAVDEAMSTPLDPSRPLWELRVADDLPGGRIGIIGRAHHCMVDGLAAVELMSLLLDPTPDPPAPALEGWHPSPRAGPLALAAGGVLGRLGTGLELWRSNLETLSSPRRMMALPARALRAGRALLRSASPARGACALNRPLSPHRHLAFARRPLEDLRRIKGRFDATVNDVVLAAAASGVRGALDGRSEPAAPLKAMVPVSVRAEGSTKDLGNRISFVFLDLPCDEPDAVRRLESVKAQMDRSKRTGEPQGGDDLLRALEYAPRTVQRAVSRAVSSSWTFNLTVSNIPGPRMALYMLGCELEAAHPVVPLSEGHGVSIGMTTVGDDACFGVYGDPDCMPDADIVARGIEDSIDELAVASR